MSTSRPTNHALFQDAPRLPGTIRTTPPPPTSPKILIKVHAWAINPADPILQDRILPSYPLILGCDVAGTIVSLPANSTASSSRFRVGDRVFGFTANDGFQEYVALEHRLMAKIPEGVAFRDAVVLGLCSATSAMFLFGEEYLGLEFPAVGRQKVGKSVLVWGGASAVGSNAVQLSVAAGYDVVATCSEKNFDYVKSLGAEQVFDYTDGEVIEKLVAEIDKGECAGIFMAAGMEEGNAAACRVGAASKQDINLATSLFISDLSEVPEGVSVKQPTTFKPFPDCWFGTTKATFEGYLAEALSKGVYKIAPPPLIVNKKGLEGIQEAIDLMRIIGKKGEEGIKETIRNMEGGSKDHSISVFKLVVEHTG